MSLRTRILSLLLLLLPLLSPVAAAETIELPLEGVPPLSCDEQWMEGACPAWFTETTEEDHDAGYCVFGRMPTDVILYPARLVIDLGALAGITRIEADVREASGPGRTRLFAYRDGESTAFTHFYSGDSGDQTLAVDVEGEEVAWIAVSGWECRVYGIRLIGDAIVSLENPGWGLWKAAW